VAGTAIGQSDMISVTGPPKRSGQVSLTGHSGQNRETGRPGYDSKDKTARQFLENVYFRKIVVKISETFLQKRKLLSIFSKKYFLVIQHFRENF
jgi:hypothetical protein